ncbi:MAG: 3-deoxy-manno-octulosonate cytidylyltransferase [Flavobacteriales bacterium]
MKVIGIIPARYASTRFPGKPLVDIEGTSMIMRVYQQASKTSLLNEVIVATDDKRIFDHVLQHGGKAIMTSVDHQSGTDRCLEALQKTGRSFDIVINIQGDEPFIAPEQIEELIHCFDDSSAEIATLTRRIEDPNMLNDPNKVKAVKSNKGFALYFSRQCIPYQKNIPESDWLMNQAYFLHVGLYGYRSHILHEISQLPVSSLEKSESLEQLRWLENGYKIKIAETKHSSYGVDSPEDLKSLLITFGKKGS